MNLAIQRIVSIKLFIVVFFMIFAMKISVAHQEPRADQLGYANKKLNLIYQTLLSKIQPSDQIKLKRAQRAWIIFRDLDCTWAFGSNPIDCMIARTNSRANELGSTDFFDIKGDYLSIKTLSNDKEKNTVSKSNINLPDSLIYDGKPIDAMCFNQAKGGSLKTCGVKYQKDIKKIGQNNQLEKRGYIGYKLQFEGSSPIYGYSYYRPIAHFKDKDILFTINSDGGSGEFTAIKTIFHNGDHLNIQTYDIGDRCNNGITDVKQNKEQIFYRVNITPFEFLTLAEDNPHKLQPYDDLEACAACCAGTVLVSRNFDKNFSKATFISVDFSAYAVNPGEDTTQKPYQVCFNSLISTYKYKHQTILSLEQLKTFVSEFNKQCVR